MSAFDLATAFNLPLKHASVISNISKQQSEDPSKTIPIPLIMPYLKSSMKNGFYVFDEETPCPDVTCKYFGQKHYHCSKPRCYSSTNREDILYLHSKDFHDNIDIIEGFVYFDENVDCKLPGCVSNQTNKHFHCTRSGCNFSFIRYSSMATHEEKHRFEVQQANHQAYSDEEAPSDYVTKPESVNHTSDSFDQRPTFKDSECEILNGQSDPNNSISMLHSLQKLFHEQAKMTAMNATMASMPATPLLPPPPSPAPPTQPSQNGAKHFMYSESNPCNSPFCKLKRRNHFHCNSCNQVCFSTPGFLDQGFNPILHRHSPASTDCCHTHWNTLVHPLQSPCTPAQWWPLPQPSSQNRPVKKKTK